MILDSFNLDEKVALVTGAGRGIGQAIAIGLAEAGADVAHLDAFSDGETNRAIERTGRKASLLLDDLNLITAERALWIIEGCILEMGRLDILVNNAGIIRRSPALHYSEEYWADVMQVNLTSAFLLSQAAGKHMAERGHRGKILNAVAYTASKSGLAGLTRALANEWAPSGINVNAVAPGYFETEVTAGLRADPKRSESVLDRIPAGRWGRPSDVQGAVVFLASEASDYVHGAILPVDGGWLSS